MRDRSYTRTRDRTSVSAKDHVSTSITDSTPTGKRNRAAGGTRDRAFIFAVACVAALAVLILAKNIRESSTPLYGPPTVDKQVVMAKVEAGRLSFTEARFYVREEEGSGGPDDAARQATGEEAAAGAPGSRAREDAGADAAGSSDATDGAGGQTGGHSGDEAREEAP